MADAVGLLRLTANTHVRFEILEGFMADRAVRLSHVGFIPQMLLTFKSFTADAIILAVNSVFK